MSHIVSIVQAKTLLKEGKVIAYPTESCFGLGCDPFCEDAVERLFAIKKRSVNKGLILLISHWSQLFSLIAPIADSYLEPVRSTWPGPVTWIFPKSSSIPSWLSGEHNGIAIRMSAHPIARELSDEHPLVSTSANVSGLPMLRDIESVQLHFPTELDGIVVENIGDAARPSAIFDVLTGACLRV